MQPTCKREDSWSRDLARVGQLRDRAAFESLFDHFAPLIKGFCLSNPAVSNEAAEECMQEVMLKVWQKAPYYEAHRVSASTWIFTLVRNCHIGMRRRNSSAAPFPALEVDDIWDETTETQPFVFLQRSRNQEDVNHRLQNLPVEQFHVVKKFYTDRLSHQEISSDLGLPAEAVRARLRLALKKLQLNTGR